MSSVFSSKSPIFIATFILFSVFYLSCNSADKNVKKSEVSVATLWRQNCSICHGKDGTLGLNGAKDLRLSELTLEERINIISNGKGTMTAFKNRFSETEIAALAEFTLSFK